MGQDFQRFQDADSLAVLGYVITSNRQVHNYQLYHLEKYLSEQGFLLGDTVLPGILDGKDDAVPLQQIIKAFSKENETVKAELIYQAILLAYLDGCFDTDEADIISAMIAVAQLQANTVEGMHTKAQNESNQFRIESDIFFTRPKHTSKKGSWLKRLFLRIVEFFKRLFHLSDKSPDEKSLYIDAIRRCSVIAKEDFEIVKDNYDQIIAKCAEAQAELENIVGSFSCASELASDIAGLTESFAKALENNILSQENAAVTALVQKERSLSDFTISLVGRTKAGKTTLHAILTGEGDSKIGVGEQRTTRYNRVYQWNMLRLIDTPGIGSGEDDGRKDEEVAESVLGETDIICFLVVDDSILGDILSFMERVAQHHKPIIVLLNHREDIRPEVKFKRFLKDPTGWMSHQGESRLDGHVDRIMRYARGKGFDKLLTIFPVFLLPALMARQDEYKEHSDLLWDSSNIEEFIGQIKSWIIQYGRLKRSETIVDGTIQSFTNSRKRIEAEQAPLQSEIGSLKSKAPQIIDKLKKVQACCIEELQRYIESRLDQLRNQELRAFAEANYKSKDIAAAWESFIEETGFQADINNKMTSLGARFSKEIDTTVQEVLEDFYFSMQYNASIGNIKPQFSLDLKSFSRILGGAINLIGTIIILFNPLGWIAVGLGTVIQLSSLFFKSKEQRQQERIEKIVNSIQKALDERETEFIQSATDAFGKSTNEAIDKINALFGILVEQVSKALAVGNSLIADFDQRIEVLNHVYAWRIIEFLRNDTTPITMEEVEKTIASVKHIDGGAMQIYKYGSAEYKQSELDLLSNVLAESVQIIQEVSL